MRRAIFFVIALYIFPATVGASTKLFSGSFEKAVSFYVMIKLCSDNIFISQITLKALDDEFKEFEENTTLSLQEKTRIKKEVLEQEKSSLRGGSIFTKEEQCNMVKFVIDEYELELKGDSIFPNETRRTDDKRSEILKKDSTASDVVRNKFSETTGSMRKLPIEDGHYVRSDLQCSHLKAGTLEFIELTVENAGSAYSLPESGCVVAKIQALEENTFAVTGNCREADQIWQHQFFLSQRGNGRIELDGSALQLCAAQSQGNLTQLETDDLFNIWIDKEEGCRGGLADDPKTDESCADRAQVTEELHRRNWCYGKEDQSTSEFDWHQCQKDSIR